MVSLTEVSSAPGSSHERVLKVLESREEGVGWLENRGYKLNKNVNYWEHPKDEDFFVWTYVKIRGIS